MMSTQSQSQSKAATDASRAPLQAGLLQRKCACGQHTIAGECTACSKEREGTLQRSAISHESVNGHDNGVPSIANEVLRSPGQPLDTATRAFMEPRFGHDFSHVRVHTGGQAGESAHAVRARAYTVGHDVVFAAGEYMPGSATGRHLLAHELTHVLQQDAAAKPTPQRAVESTASGGYRIAIAPALADEFDSGETQADAEADAIADRVVATDSRASGHHAVQVGQRVGPGIHRVRIPLGSPVPLCGRTVTHIDVEPPRTRPLVPCTTMPVTRINIVGRQVTPATTGMGRMIFNLHIGYYRNPATGRLCVIADDSLTCVAPRCLSLGCFPTFEEVIDAIWNFLKNALLAILLLAAAIIIFLLLRGARFGPVTEPLPGPILAGRREGEGGEGGGEAGGQAATAEA
jgi:hypothetical protein